ncbi:MAG: double-strand break repair helicase AddA, partial [Paracoccaceae bacterium]
MSADDATRRQIRAADPQVSTWLAANAGSGKTRVLTDRVARLLQQGVLPQNILCLTYTRAAASEMQIRLFKTLGSWSMLDDQRLSDALVKIGVAPGAAPDRLAHARTLFARAIETPGGLRIQTIHSFCASLLRRFPLEAGVSPVFREIEDRAARLLCDDIVDEMAAGEDARLVHEIAREIADENFSKLMLELVRNRAAFSTPADRTAIWRLFGLSADFDFSQVVGAAFVGGEMALVQKLIPLLAASDKTTDLKSEKILKGLDLRQPGEFEIDGLIDIFLFKKSKKQPPFSAKIDSFPTKNIRETNPGIVSPLNAFMARIQTARDLRISLLSAQKTLALHEFAAVFLAKYETRKAARGWLDFDDLIGRARALLSDPATAQWVLFRLDGGIDHILVDEAQDTSPRQWDIIRLLAQEFSAGLGASPEVARTLFIVGDLKQSIFSFQGADPEAFDRMRLHFSSRIRAAGQPFFEGSLDHSFRSSPAILGLVDATFAEPADQGVATAPRHIAFHRDLPGRVDLWPPVAKSVTPEPGAWFDPGDRLGARDHHLELARKIAEQIAEMQKSGALTDKDGKARPIRFGDFLILVQRRSQLFHQIIRACKSRGLPVAGADRLKIAGELAVKDLSALLGFLALPEDDLSLAAALRSPLFALSEAALYDLAHTRHEKRLWPALVRRQSEFSKAFETLSALRNRADFDRPFELLERILTRHGGRAALVARLGSEAEDGIDAMLDQAIHYERTEPASLTGFLVWLGATEIEIKRRPDAAGERIRVMTTHGAKGLES